jgi:hypothetical protein
MTPEMSGITERMASTSLSKAEGSLVAGMGGARLEKNFRLSELRTLGSGLCALGSVLWALDREIHEVFGVGEGAHISRQIEGRLAQEAEVPSKA